MCLHDRLSSLAWRNFSSRFLKLPNSSPGLGVSSAYHLLWTGRLAFWRSRLGCSSFLTFLNVRDVGAATASLGFPRGSSTPPFRRPILRPGPQLACIHEFRRSDLWKQTRLLVRCPGKQKPALPSCTQQSDPYCIASLSQLSGLLLTIGGEKCHCTRLKSAQPLAIPTIPNAVQ